MRMTVLHDMFTGPDGQSYAIGRVYSLPVLVLGLAYPLTALIKGHPWSPIELAGYLPAIGGATWVFIQGHKSADEEPRPSPIGAHP